MSRHGVSPRSQHLRTAENPEGLNAYGLHDLLAALAGIALTALAVFMFARPSRADYLMSRSPMKQWTRTAERVYSRSAIFLSATGAALVGLLLLALAATGSFVG